VELVFDRLPRKGQIARYLCNGLIVVIIADEDPFHFIGHVCDLFLNGLMDVFVLLFLLQQRIIGISNTLMRKKCFRLTTCRQTSSPIFICLNSKILLIYTADDLVFQGWYFGSFVHDAPISKPTAAIGLTFKSIEQHG
jgi:hypothetical protein